MISLIAKLLISLRYRVRITGLEHITATKGLLILPNHPAEVDPVILSTQLWNRLRPRPVVLESFYFLPGVIRVMRFISAIPMPDMGFESGPYKRKRVASALQAITDALQGGSNVLIYPSGRLSVHGPEVLGGASGVHAILQANPSVPVVLVRIRGLYGSIFSKAFTGGRTPELFPTLRRAGGILVRNLFIFAPRRDVTIEISFNPPEFPRHSNAQTLNRYLENWYNTPNPETPSLVSHSFLSDELPQLPSAATGDKTEVEISEEIRERIIIKISALSKVPREKLSPEQNLGDDLGLDSLTIAELLLWLDQEFEVTDLDLGELVTVENVMQAAAGQLGTAGGSTPLTVSGLWTDLRFAPPQPHVAQNARNIPEAFISAACRAPDAAALGDPRSGVLTWSRVLTASILVARKLKEVPGNYVGLLFPASAGGSIVAIGAMLAGKIPVFLNWTAGKRAIEHAIQSTGLAKVITSRAFLDIVQSDLEYLEEQFVFTEEILGSASLLEKYSARRAAEKGIAAIEEEFEISAIDPASPAVVLFTSGSESLPKGVPLSHSNLLSNIRGVIDAFHLQSDDVLLGFLPPFHSFGLTICTLMPLTTGLRVAYHPNPNESRKIAKAIPAWKVTLATGTPTFLRSILRAGDREQFKSLRILVSGAEKAPAELFQMVDDIGSGVRLLEGYGITECSPVVTVNRPESKACGVGKPFLDVEIAVVHPESMAPQPDGDQGLILIRGRSVFTGYLGTTANPFVTFNNDQWYNSGDLGFLQEGTLTITGRLKRFIKIGGEMISLGAVEDALLPHAASIDGAPTLAVLPVGTEGGARPQLVLFTTSDLTTDRSNQILKEHGLPQLVRLNDVRRVDIIPVLGSGKTDYQSLKGLL